MNDRGPKYGWILGGFGSILWLLILAFVLLYQGKTAAFLGCFFFFAGGAAYIFLFAPWKYPRTPFWRIYLGLVLILTFAAMALIHLWYPEAREEVRGYRFLLMLLPLLIPVFIVGRKTWNDMHGGRRDKSEP
jgi:hypothetical protein